MSDLTEEQLLAKLRSMIGYHGGERIFAQDLVKQYGVSQSYLSNVLNGSRGIADKLANAMGYERVVTFRPISTPDASERG